MTSPPIPPDEERRLGSLHSLCLLDTPPEERFDRIVRMAARVLGVPIALVSLVDARRQWFKARVGLEAPETEREISFCGHALLHDRPLIVPDALKDLRFADNPLVRGEPYIRFYAGQPIHAPDGLCVGTLCVIDRKPRDLSDDERAALRDLGAWAERELGAARLEEEASAFRESEADLRQRDEQLRLQADALETVANAITITDRDGIIQWVNLAFTDLTGYSGEEVIGQPTRLLKSGRHEPAFYQSLWRTVLSGQVWRGEMTNRRKNGDLYFEEMTITPVLDAAGRVSHFVAIKQDITERKQIDRMKNEFISTVSHELRTPLTSIRGSLGLLQGGVVGELPAQARALVDIAVNNSDRLVRLINDILDIEKIESGRIEFRREPLDLLAVVRQAMRDNEGYAAQFGVRFQLETALLEAPVVGDSDRLLQVMANLLSNAAKFSPQGGTVDVGVALHEGGVRVGVHDQGPGVPEQFHPRIFRKFAQADSSDTRQKGGTGLGLSISKAIVERHGGRIAFETVQGAGTTFFFDLPTPRAELARPRVLIVEDNREVAQVLEVVFEQEGLDVKVALGADEAKELLAREEFAAMTLDMILPGSSGASLIRDLGADPRTRALPVVVISGEPRDEAAMGEGSPIVAWLQKPADATGVIRAIRAALECGSPSRTRPAEGDRRGER